MQQALNDALEQVKQYELQTQLKQNNFQKTLVQTQLKQNIFQKTLVCDCIAAYCETFEIQFSCFVK